MTDLEYTCLFFITFINMFVLWLGYKAFLSSMAVKKVLTIVLDDLSKKQNLVCKTLELTIEQLEIENENIKNRK